jgi:hypothetical protein
MGYGKTGAFAWKRPVTVAIACMPYLRRPFSKLRMSLCPEVLSPTDSWIMAPGQRGSLMLVISTPAYTCPRIDTSKPSNLLGFALISQTLVSMGGALDAHDDDPASKASSANTYVFQRIPLRSSRTVINRHVHFESTSACRACSWVIEPARAVIGQERSFNAERRVSHRAWIWVSHTAVTLRVPQSAPSYRRLDPCRGQCVKS